MARIFEYPTIEQLAAFLRQNVAFEPRGTLVPIQVRGERPALFCVHPAGGLANAYVQLARELGSDQPLYAFQSRGFDQGEPIFSRIQEMAAEYILDLRKVKPKGPYLLAGWSTGGLIAYEIAQQLFAAAERVELLALLDAAAVEPKGVERSPIEVDKGKATQGAKKQAE